MSIENRDPQLAAWLDALAAPLGEARLARMMQAVQARVDEPPRPIPLPRYFWPLTAGGAAGAAALGLWAGILLGNNALPGGVAAALLQFGGLS